MSLLMEVDLFRCEADLYTAKSIVKSSPWWPECAVWKFGREVNQICLSPLILNCILKVIMKIIGHPQRVIGNQFIILKTGKGKESSITPAFSKWTEPVGNQIVDEGWNRFINVFQLISEKEIVELKYHHFIIPTDSGSNYQWLLTSQKIIKRYVPPIVLPKGDRAWV